jgi:hypothetical protein
VSKNLHLTDDRYLAALYRQRDRIIAGAEFAAIDSTTPGDKFTEASWGLCTREPEAWPDRDDHLWPEQFDEGRIAPKYRTENQPCPMQRKGGGTGCFYSCRIFKGSEITAAKRAEAIELYEAAIGAARKASK